MSNFKFQGEAKAPLALLPMPMAKTQLPYLESCNVPLFQIDLATSLCGDNYGSLSKQTCS